MDISQLTSIFAYVIYAVLALVALWGAVCAILVWMRIGQLRFRSDSEQDAFLDEIEPPLERGDFPSAEAVAADDARATPTLAHLAIARRESGYAATRTLVLDHFQRDVLSDLEYRLSWVFTVIKAAPMVGLLGTVVGMMGAFAKLAAGQETEANDLAQDISLALITTACGLAIAIPLVFCTASINVKIRKLEDSVSAGLTRFFESFRKALSREANK